MDAETISPQEDSPAATVAEHLLEVVPRLWRLIAAEAQKAESADEVLTTSQLRALGLLTRGVRLTGELARHMGITPATASEIVDLLVRRGLVERGEPGDDRRQTPLRATPEGLALHRAGRRRAVHALRALASRIDRQDAEALDHGLRALIALLGETQTRPGSDDAD